MPEVGRNECSGNPLLAAQAGRSAQADGSHAEHFAGIARAQPAGPHGMQGKRCRFECSGLIEADFVRKQVDRVPGYHD